MPEVTINIAHRTYRLAVSSGEETLIRSCAEKVDQQIALMKENSNLISQEQIAVLAALEIAYEARKASLGVTEADSGTEKPTSPTIASEELFKRLEEKDREIESLKSTIVELRKKMKELEFKGSTDVALLKEIDELSSLCEKAIYTDMHKIGLF